MTGNVTDTVDASLTVDALLTVDVTVTGDVLASCMRGTETFRGMSLSIPCCLYLSFAAARSVASKYHTVMAYLQSHSALNNTILKHNQPSRFIIIIVIDLCRCAGSTSCGFRLSDQKKRSLSNFGSISATLCLICCGYMRSTPPSVCTHSHATVDI